MKNIIKKVLKTIGSRMTYLLVGLSFSVIVIVVNAAVTVNSTHVSPGSALSSTQWNTLVDDVSNIASGENATFLVIHSQTNSVPTLPTGAGAGWTKLWEGYSYAGGYLSGGWESPQDLGSSGSCLPRFDSVPFTECTSPNCDHITTGDYSMWLTDLTTALGADSAANYQTHISRCAVWVSNKPLLTIHSMSSASPATPSGWTKVWDGYSLGGIYLSSGFGSGQDLGSTGSCLRVFKSLPFVECYYPNCHYVTTGDYGLWMSSYAFNTDFGSTTGANTANNTSRCSVFTKL